MRISDWSSDVCSSDLLLAHREAGPQRGVEAHRARGIPMDAIGLVLEGDLVACPDRPGGADPERRLLERHHRGRPVEGDPDRRDRKSTRLELQSLMRISYAVFCLQKQTEKNMHRLITLNVHRDN